MPGPGIASAPLSPAQIAGRLRSVDGVGSGIEADVHLLRRPSAQGVAWSQSAGIAASPPDPSLIRVRAILGV
jgi:hypothetical protein